MMRQCFMTAGTLKCRITMKVSVRPQYMERSIPKKKLKATWLAGTTTEVRLQKSFLFPESGVEINDINPVSKKTIGLLSVAVSQTQRFDSGCLGDVPKTVSPYPTAQQVVYLSTTLG